MMKIFGYEPNRAMLDEHPPFDAVAAPYFHQGGEVGCLVLHGIGGTPANVRLVAEALAREGCTVYAPLLPGHGETIRALDRSTGAQWLHAVFAAYDRLRAAGCTKIVPIGLSLGGILAGYIAAKRETAALVLISAPIRMKTYLRLGRLLSPLFPYIAYSERDKARTRELAPYAQMYSGFCTRKLCDLQRLILRLRARLPRIGCPVFALWAKYDNKVSASSRRLLRNGLRQVDLTEHTLQNSSHGSTYGAERDLAAELVAAYVRSTVLLPLRQTDSQA